MSAENSRKRFRQEATCPICLSYFTGPVMLQCGHNFCEICIRQCWQEPDAPTRCPQCRGPVEKDFKPNQCLINLVEILNDWDMETEACNQASECQRHQKPLSLFCKEDQVLLCEECDGSQEHLGHSMAPMKEVAQEYKVQISNYLEILREAKESVMDYRVSIQRDREDMTERTKVQKRKITAHFRQLCQHLDELQEGLVDQIDEVEREITRRKDEHLGRITNELSSLERLIQELEEKCRQPASKLLQDIQSTLVKYKERQKFETPEVFPPELKLKIWECVDLDFSIHAVIKLFKDNLRAGLPLQKANLTLEVSAPNPILTVSEDQKSMRRTAKLQDLPINRKKFSPSSIAFGRPALTTGRHFWDVSLGNGEHWAVGVVKESAMKDLSEFIMRKGCFKADYKKGIWAVKSLTRSRLSRPNRRLLRLQNLKRVRVIMNYTGQRMAFLNIDNGNTILSSTDIPLSGEPIIPFFWLGAGACLTLS